jgi:hypothetical protein
MLASAAFTAMIVISGATTRYAATLLLDNIIEFTTIDTCVPWVA